MNWCISLCNDPHRVYIKENYTLNNSFISSWKLSAPQYSSSKITNPPSSFIHPVLIAQGDISDPGNIARTLLQVMPDGYAKQETKPWVFIRFAGTANTSCPGWYRESIHRSLKKYRARHGSTRWKGNGTRSVVRIPTNVHGTSSSCNYCNAVRHDHPDECTDAGG